MTRPPPTADQLAAATRAAAAVLDRPVEDVRVTVAGPRGRKRKVTDDEIAAAIKEHGSIRAAAAALGVSEGAIRNRRDRASPTGKKKK